MNANEKVLNTFATRVRQMILQYEEVKKENTDLCELVGKRDKEIEKLEAQLKQARNDYNSLKMAKMIEISDGDMENAQKREDEEYYRAASKLITDTVNTYATYFKGKKSDKDILYMAMLDITLHYKKEGARNDTAPFKEVLGKLTSEIEEALKNNQDKNNI